MKIHSVRLTPAQEAKAPQKDTVTLATIHGKAEWDLRQTETGLGIKLPLTVQSTQHKVGKSHSSHFRVVNVGQRSKGENFAPNVIRTSIYTRSNFLPKNLFKQFTRFSNIYFLFITALQLIPEVTSTPGFPTMIAPLVFIVVVSAVRDLIEDLDRHRSDDLQNLAIVNKLELHSSATNGPMKFSPRTCAEIAVGDLVRIATNENVPADVVIVATSENRGQCLITTANLDGEPNLKSRYAPSALCFASFRDRCFSPQGELTDEGIDRLKHLTIECEPPSRRIDRFKGSIKLEVGAVGAEVFDLDISNILLRGTNLKDALWVVGVVIYTGEDTRVRQNSSETSVKQGWLLRFINKTTQWVVLAQTVILTVAVAIERRMVSSKAVMQNPFVDDDEKKTNTRGLIYLFLAYTLLFSNFIPISLQVTIDFMRYFQTKVLHGDADLQCSEQAPPLSLPPSATVTPRTKQVSVRVQSSELNEELGLVEHIFSDKTGTLTCNQMEFRSCHVDGRTFEFEPKIGTLVANNSSFTACHVSSPCRNCDNALPDTCRSSDEVNCQSISHSPQMLRFFLNLAVNNSISPNARRHPNDMTSDDGSRTRLLFSGASPDGKALVSAAAHIGISLIQRDNTHMRVNVNGRNIELQILRVFEFSSDRKKSSIVCRHPDGKIVLYCKGADTVILRDLSNKNSADKLRQARDQMLRYSDRGLRVLCIADRELSEEEYSKWSSRFMEKLTIIRNTSKARPTPLVESDRDEVDAMSSVVSELESDLTLVGVSAIEDKIQEEAPKTLEKLREAGIKVWMLTGDRPDTATNVAHTVRLITRDMHLIKLTETHWLQSRMTAMHFFQKELTKAQDGAYNPKKQQHQLHTEISYGSEHQPRLALSQRPCLAMILDDTAIEAVLKFGLDLEFLQLCMQCESVICARISPKQKEVIIDMVRIRCPNKVTMAIGDGANDVPMIQRAHIGVGIAGVEGIQASDASDYSVPAFQYLQKLVLVHGRAMNRRIAVLTLYTFYKNVLLVLPQLFYGAYCLFSGQSSYYDPLLQLFNICFTALPVLFFSVLDQDLSPTTVLRYPQLYQDGPYRTFLNTRAFLGWMVEAIFESILIVIVPVKLIPLVPWSSTGKDNDLWSLGLTQNFIVVFLANVRLLLEVSTHQRLMISLVSASILFWWAVVFVMSSTVAFGREFYGILTSSSLAQLALCTCFCSILSLLVALLPRAREVLFAPKPRTICRELEFMCAKNRENTG